MPEDFSADPTLQWDTNLSEKHEEISEDLDGMLDDFSAGKALSPLAVVGPYGAGKTQYLYEVFRRAWNRGIPAVYTDLKSILSEYEGTDVPISTWIREKINEEVPRILEQEDPNWFPVFRTSEQKQEFYREFIDDQAVESDKYVLLIDEVEQKYTELEKYVGTDDKNPLREILDGLTDVFQVWSFGLVSAYEIIGEADRRRFEEVRIPITDIDTVWTQLQQENHPTELANGIWWLSRGRAGWIAKHSEKLDRTEVWDDETFQSWLDEAADHSYYGAVAIDTVWEEVPASKIPDAKKTILFSEPAYDPWTIEANNVISVARAHNVLLDAIREENELTGDVFDIVDSNLLDILYALAPPANWTIDENGEVDRIFLPANAFSRDEYMEGLINTVSDFISSFEKRGDVRKDAIRILGEVNIQSLTSKWSDLLDPLEKADDNDINPWTVDPSIVREAYPPLALNPEELTENDTAELRRTTSDPIEFDTGLSLRGGTLTVKLCPTESAFENATGELSNYSDVTETTVLLVPDQEDARRWELPQHARRLKEFNLLTIGYIGGQRIWDLILQLDEYMEIRDYEGVLSPGLVQETIMPNEPRDQVRNTINALFTDLERLSNEVASSARSSFKAAYSLEAAGGLIWQDEGVSENDEGLATREPYYGTTSRAATSKLGIEYGVVFSSKSFNEGIEYTKLVRGLLRAIDDEFIEQRPFRFTYFLRRTFEEDGSGLTEWVTEVRRKYVTETGELKGPVLRLQRALGYLSELNGQSPNELYELLKNLDSESGDITVIADASAGETQAEELFWGLLLDWVLRDLTESLVEDLEQTQSSLEKLYARVDEIQQQIGFINERLEPPADISVEDELNIKINRIERYQENIDDILTGMTELIQQVREFPDLSASVVALWSATIQYEDLMSDTIEELQNLFGGLNLYSNINELKSEYNSLRSWLGSTENLQETSINKADLLEKTDILGQCIFDYPTRVGKKNIPIKQAGLLEDLDSIIEDDVRQLERLNSQTETIDKRAKEAEESVSEIVDALTQFADWTATSEVS